MAHAEVGDGNYVVGDAQDLAKLGKLEDADPSHADPLAAGSQPEVLDGAAGGVDIGFRHRVAAQDYLGPGWVAGDAQVDRRLEDSFQLEGQVG